MECGEPAAAFWDSAGREFRAIVKGAVAGIKRERDLAIAAAWHGAWLTAYAPQKSGDFIRLDRLISDRPAQGRARDWQHSFASWSAWAGSFQQR